MIEVLTADASDDEIAAIAIALSSRTAAGSPSPWAIAAHYPELDFDELHALVTGR